jgi:hypothetical protein
MQNKLELESFLNLPSEDGKFEIARRLPTPDVLNYAGLSKHYSSLFTPILNTRQFLHYGVRGDYTKVKAMLEKEIELIYEQGLLTDYGGHTFKNISLFEYTLWAKDKFLWEAMLECIPQNEKRQKIIEKCLAQYKNLKENGVTYCFKGKYFTEPHFDFDNTIIKELQAYVDLVNQDNVDWNKADEQWQKGVGGAQSRFPIHVVYEYCSDRPFDPLPDFKEQPKTLSKQFYNWLTSKYESWFSLGSKLGGDFAIIKAGRGLRCGGGGARVGAPRDLNAMKALCKARTEDFNNLEAQLEELLSIDNHPKLQN